MKIAVLGGTFDPPHFGHLLVARQIMENFSDIDRAWLLPANTNPDKKIYAPTSHRLKMAQFLKEERIDVCDLDIKRGGETLTIDSIRQLIKIRDHKFTWIIGSDLLSTIKFWEGYGEFIKLVPFIVFPRPEYPIKSVPVGFKVLKESHLLTANYSSTVIRARVRQGLSIEGLTPHEVTNYINKHHLY